MAKARASRNKPVAKGVGRLSRSAVFRKARRWAGPKTTKVVKKAESATTAPVVKDIGGANNGGKRTIVPKAPKFYPAEDAPKPLRALHVNYPTKLKASVTPGTVLILLAGRFKGKRVVFLKQLASGLLLVTGPFKINGVPLRRVNQSYVIGTSTKVDTSNFPNLDKFTDDYFKRPKEATHKKSEEEFFAPEEKKKEIAPQRKDDQKEIDGAILETVKKTPLLRQYLNARFSLTKYQAPHELKF